jgi:ABC-2 type transporter
MKSLKQLAVKDGVTVVSVIHQPRKFIFDLFDSLILLGVGGRMVYHGRTKDAESYFCRLNYFLPAGESMADWLIDISSGRLETESNIASNKKEERLRLYKQTNQGRMKKLNIPSTRSFATFGEESKNGSVQECYAANTIKDDDETDGTSSSRENGCNPVDGMEKARPLKSDKSILFAASSDDDEREAEAGDPELATLMSRAPHLGSTPGRVVTDGSCVGAKGVTTGKITQAFEEAKVRRAWLYDEWIKHMANLTPDQKAIYEPPEKYDLPFHVQKPLFWYQFGNQLRRAVLVAWRNRFSKIVDCTIIVVAVIVITALDGTTEVSLDINPDIPYEIMVRPLTDDIETIFQQLFAYSLTRQIQYVC